MSDYAKRPYFHVGRASDLSSRRDRILYRFLEIVPGLLSWGTIGLCFVLSFFIPVYVALFIIAFDLYWLLKTAYLSLHLRHNWQRMKYNLGVDWEGELAPIKHDHLLQMVILPYYNESETIVRHSIESLIRAKWDKKTMALVLATEERAGKPGQDIADKMKAEYGHLFNYFLITIHPSDTVGELKGKGSNITYAAKEARVKILDANHISYENVIVSAFDIDTVVYPQYFECVAWHFLTSTAPHNHSYQPVPLYNNNIWQAPAFSRVVATSSTFWQMVQQERPEKLATFSSHSLSFKALHEGGYWQTNMVSEDSRIFWNLYLANDGNYSVVPLSYPVSMDANLALSFWETMKNIYKQHRRWTWGVENVPYILFGFIKNKEIPLGKKIRMAFVQIEGFWSLATNPIMIFLLGWMPLILGGARFNTTILARNLPILTRDLMTLSMLGLILSAIICMSFLPARPPEAPKHRHFFMILQWILVPLTITIFGAIPGLDAQTRLMFGNYLGFWVTPKHRT